jgi:hypothetical protein
MIGRLLSGLAILYLGKRKFPPPPFFVSYLTIAMNPVFLAAFVGPLLFEHKRAEIEKITHQIRSHVDKIIDDLHKKALALYNQVANRVGHTTTSNKKTH